jgi:SHS2 domain-containing protein
VERVPGLVKAATLHGLRVEEVAGGWEGEVVLDV